MQDDQQSGASGGDNTNDGATHGRSAQRSLAEAPILTGHEISARTGFSRNRLWRDGEHRTDESFARAVEHPHARFHLTTSDGKWLCKVAGPAVETLPPRFGGDASRQAAHPLDAAFDLAGARAQGARFDAAVLLGFDGDARPHLAAPIPAGSPTFDETEAGDAPGSAAPRDGAAIKAIDLRSLAMQGALDPATEGQLGQAAHLIGWHSRNGFCARCGGRAVSEAAGYRRRCLNCDAVVFPRTDPVTIMLVHDGRGNCILGRQPQFPEQFWSCLAGFVEAGETVEDAVRRETLEEAGVHVGRVSYLASQPWPFPGSLMIGCTAIAEDFDIAFDGEELEACRWFARDEVDAMLAGRHPDGLTVPSRFAIAHHLVKAFADGLV